MGTHQIALDTFGNPEHSNYLLFKRFLRRTRSSNKRWRPFVREHPFCLLEQIPPKYKYTGNYCWQPRYWYLGCQHQIPNTVIYYMGTSLKLNLSPKYILDLSSVLYFLWTWAILKGPWLMSLHSTCICGHCMCTISTAGTALFSIADVGLAKKGETAQRYGSLGWTHSGVT